jgi:hypothetical protein
MKWKTVFRELVDLRGGALQIAQYIGVLSGLKRSLDDWIPHSQLRTYIKLIRELGLALELDCIFSRLQETQQPAFGSRYAPTTQALGRPLSERQVFALLNGRSDEPFDDELKFARGDEVHVVVGHTPEWAADTLGAAWYPLVVENRIVTRPHIDAHRLGLALGYPECCVRFFMKHNQWSSENQFAESFNASRTLSWLANCFAKHTRWMIIYHMPCAFDCAATIEYSTLLLREVRGFDSAFAASIEAYLRQTLVVSNERLAFTLTGTKPSGLGRMRYAAVKSLQEYILLRDPLHDDYLQNLMSGDELQIADGTIFIWKNGRLVHSIETYCDHGIADVPLLLDFEER